MGNVHLLSALKWLAYLHSLIAPLSALAASGELRAAALSSLVCYDPDASMPEELERRFSFGAAAAAAALFEDSPTAEYADTASAARRASEFTSSADSFSSRRLSPPVTRRAARNRKLLLRRVSEEAEGESGDARTAVTSPVAAARDQSNGANTSRSPVAHSDVEDERCRLLWVERREGPYEMRQVQEEMQTPDEKSELVINGRNRILL